MASHGTWFDPQVGLVIHNYLDHKEKFLGADGYTEEGFAKMQEVLPLNIEMFKRALKTQGLKIVFGTDAVAGAHGRNAEEFIYRVRDGIYAADMLLAAIVHLDLFSWLAEHPATRDEICRALAITDRPADVMLTLFAAMGLVDERQGVFHLTMEAREHLVKTSPWFLGPYYEPLKNRPMALDLRKVLRTGKPAAWSSQKDGQDWHKAMESEAFAAQFTAAMDCRGIYLAQAVAKSLDLSRHRRLLDIAGGSGVYYDIVLAAQQKALAMVKPGAPLVYSVCSLQPEERKAVIDAVSAEANLARLKIPAAAIAGENQFLTRDGELRTLPSQWGELGGLDGFYGVLLQRTI